MWLTCYKTVDMDMVKISKPLNCPPEELLVLGAETFMNSGKEKKIPPG